MKSLHTKQDSLRTKLCALQDSLDAMKGCLHDEKSKRRKVMFDEELRRKRLENEIQTSMIGYPRLTMRGRLLRKMRNSSERNTIMQ